MEKLGVRVFRSDPSRAPRTGARGNLKKPSNKEVTTMIRMIKTHGAALAAASITTDPEGCRYAVEGGGTG